MGREADDKCILYREHVADCRACDLCGTKAVNPAHGGFATHPSPWAMLMGALDADVVVVGQDFASQDEPRYEPDPTFQTNKSLLALVETPGLDNRRIYLTNAVLCLKPGRTSANVPKGWAENCTGNLRRT